MVQEQRARIQEALSFAFDQHEAKCLGKMLFQCMEKEVTNYEELDIECAEKDDHILSLFEQRLLIPIKSGTGSSWEEKSLELRPGEAYSMPPVARSMLRFCAWSARPDPEQALTGVLAMCPAVDAQSLVRLVMHGLQHSTSYRLEAGLFGALARRLGLELDLHQAVDLLVTLGVLSPCKAVSMASGISRYEIHPCLFWSREDSFK
ncbi:MAG: hypothetical protein ACLFOA_07125 [Desulfohalobiaceae bacterium]